MKITIEHYGNVRTSQISDESDIFELMDEVLGLVEFTGYHKQSINRYITEKAEEIEHETTNN